MGACWNILLCKGVKYIQIQYRCSYMRVYAEYVCVYIDACMYLPVSVCLSMSPFVSVFMISMYICVYLYMLSTYLHWRHACSEKFHMCIHSLRKGHKGETPSLSTVFLTQTHSHAHVHTCILTAYKHALKTDVSARRG